MRKPTFVEMNAFLVLADRLSFRRAATQLGISTSTLSGTIRTLEERLDVRLVNRSNRSVALTEAGERLASSIRPVLNDYGAVIESLNANRGKPAGMLRITTWPTMAIRILSPLLPRFMAEYPDVTIEISPTRVPFKGDIVADQFDVGIDLGERIASDMIAIRIGRPGRAALVGSPAYFARNPPPQTPQDLRRHNCIRQRYPDGTMMPWRTQRDGQIAEFTVGGTLILNDRELQLRAALDGLGLLWGNHEALRALVDEGKLIQVLDDWAWESTGPFLYYPSKRQVPAHVQAFINFVKAEYAAFNRAE